MKLHGMDAMIGAMAAAHPFDGAVRGADGNAAKCQGKCGEPMAMMEDAEKQCDGESGPKPAGEFDDLKDDVGEMDVFIYRRMVVDILC